MAQRLMLQSALEAILGSRNVYFQPPSGFQMQYPCIVYTLDNDFVARADNKIFHRRLRYSVTSIDWNPESATPDKLVELPYSSFERSFVADGLNHQVFNIYH